MGKKLLWSITGREATHVAGLVLRQRAALTSATPRAASPPPPPYTVKYFIPLYERNVTIYNPTSDPTTCSLPSPTQRPNNDQPRSPPSRSVITTLYTTLPGSLSLTPQSHTSAASVRATVRAECRCTRQAAYKLGARGVPSSRCRFFRATGSSHWDFSCLAWLVAPPACVYK